MDRNSRLEPSMLSAQSNSAISILQTNNADLGILQAAVSQFVGNSEIKSSSFDNLKQQMNDYNTCIDGMRSANESDIADHQSLISALGSANGSMNGNDIFDEKETAEQGEAEAEQAADNARWCAGLFAFLNNADVRYYFERLADTHDEEARNWNEIILCCQEQIDIYDEIEAATSGLFVSGTAMRNIAGSALEEVKGAFQNGVYTPNMNAAWRAQLQSQAEITATEYLLAQGLTRQEIMNMLGLGYTATDIKYQWDLCKTDIEKQFFRNLMAGTEESYIEAFETDPYKLSDDLTFIMSEYSYRLFEYGQSTQPPFSQLTDFNNAILSGIGCHTNGPIVEYYYRNIYLDKLYAGSAILLESDAVLLAAMNPGDAGYADLYEKYQQRAAVTNMWTIENLMVDYLSTHHTVGLETTQLSVSNLNYEGDGELKFDFKRYSYSFGEEVTNHIDGDFLEGGSLVEGAYQLQNLRELQEAKDNLLSSYVGKFLGGAAAMAAGAIAPELAIAVSIGVMLLENAGGSNSVGSISRLDSMLVKSEAAKLGINLSQSAAANAINYALAYQKAGQRLDAANEMERMAWFGTGGTYSIEGGRFHAAEEGAVQGISYTGVYNPDTIRLMAQWEEKGLESIPMWGPNRDECLSEDMKKDILEKIKADNRLTDSEMKDYQDLLEGGGDLNLSEISNFEEFDEKIHQIEDAYGSGMDIQRQWNNQTEVSARATSGR